MDSLVKGTRDQEVAQQIIHRKEQQNRFTRVGRSRIYSSVQRAAEYCTRRFTFVQEVVQNRITRAGSVGENIHHVVAVYRFISVGSIADRIHPCRKQQIGFTRAGSRRQDSPLQGVYCKRKYSPCGSCIVYILQIHRYREYSRGNIYIKHVQL